ncbi:hypothetical protein J5839_02865 [Methanosarcinaceae archaeon]|nr:hypothetical protein [Methanosarcinaceae archaeon]
MQEISIIEKERTAPENKDRPADRTAQESGIVREEENIPENGVPAEMSGRFTVGHCYIKPAAGEKDLIYVLDIVPKIACWLPGLRQTLYLEELPPTDEFKRVRFVVLLHIYDWSSARDGIIELTEAEYPEFARVYEAYLRTGGELYYYREKRGRKMWHLFELRPGDRKDASSLKRSVLSEKFRETMP